MTPQTAYIVRGIIKWRWYTQGIAGGSHCVVRIGELGPTQAKETTISCLKMRENTLKGDNGVRTRAGCTVDRLNDPILLDSSIESLDENVGKTWFQDCVNATSTRQALHLCLNQKSNPFIAPSITVRGHAWTCPLARRRAEWNG